MTILFIIIYLIGVVLAYGRVNADYYEIWKIRKNPNNKNVFDNDFGGQFSCILMMVISYFALISYYFPHNSKVDFLRFKNWK